MCFECEGIDTNKRKFLAEATAAIVGAALTSQTFGQQQTVSEAKALDDPNVVHQAITFQNGADAVKGYLARPKKRENIRRLSSRTAIRESLKTFAMQQRRWRKPVTSAWH